MEAATIRQSGLMEELIHVPLMLRVPGSVHTELSRSPLSHIHLAPTLLDAAEVPVPDSFEGRSHWQELLSGHNSRRDRDFRMRSRMHESFSSRGTPGISGAVRPGLALQTGTLFRVSDRDTCMTWRLILVRNRLCLATVEPRVRRRLLEAAREHLRRSSVRRDSQMRVKARLRELQLEWKKPADKASPVAS